MSTPELDYSALVDNMRHSEKVLDQLRTVVPYLGLYIRNADYDRLMIVKSKLNTLKLFIPEKHHLLIQLVVSLINKTLKNNKTYQALKKRTYEDTLTDHALRRALERVYNIDVVALKKGIIKDLEGNKEFTKVSIGGKIVTVF